MDSERVVVKRLHRKHAFILCSLAFTTTVVVGVLAWWSESISSKPNYSPELKGAAVSLLTIASSVLGAMYVTLSLQAFHLIINRAERKRFINQLSIEPGDTVIFALPQYPLEAGSPDRGIRGADGRSRKTIGADTKSRWLSLDDVAAAREITKVFLLFGLDAPRIFFDDDVYRALYPDDAVSNSLKKNRSGSLQVPDMLEDEVRDAIRRAKTVIVIGLFSNSVTTTVNDRVGSPEGLSFAIRCNSVPTGNVHSVEIAPDDVLLSAWKPDGSGRLLESKGKQFAVVAKLSIDEDRSAFLVGGSNSRATRKIASHFRRSWTDPIRPGSLQEVKNIGRKRFTASFTLSNERGRYPQDAFKYVENFDGVDPR